jgi:hypothetical protein
MTRRRFPASGAPNENLSRSTSVGRSDEGMNPDESVGGDFDLSPGFLPGYSESPAPSHPAPLELVPGSRNPPRILNPHGSAQDYQLTEGPRPQDSDTDEPAPEVIEIDPNTDDRLSHSRSPNNQNSTQGWPGSSGQNSKTGGVHQNLPSGPWQDSATLQKLGYTQSEINKIIVYLRSSPNPIDANHQPVLSTESINKIHKQILVPLFRRPSLKHFMRCVLYCFEHIYKIGSLRDLEQRLLSVAKVS